MHINGPSIVTVLSCTARHRRALRALQLLAMPLPVRQPAVFPHLSTLCAAY
jgi:hypothetical protein